MIPIKDENPTYNVPFVTIILIGINILIFVLIWIQGPEAMQRIMFRFGTIPKEITGVQKFSLFQAPPGPAVPPVFTLLTSMFLHGGWFHLLGNMLYLWIFGDNVEALMGHGRFLTFYLLCGLAATLSHVLILPGDPFPMVGASGAISGVLGAYFIRFPRARVYVLFFFFFFIRIVPVSALFVLGIWFFIQVFSGLGSLGASDAGGVAWFAHIGGFVAGMILVLVFGKKGRVRVYRRNGWWW